MRKSRFAQGGFVGEIPKRVSLKTFVLSTGIYLFIVSPSRKFLYSDLDTSDIIRILWCNIKINKGL